MLLQHRVLPRFLSLPVAPPPSFSAHLLSLLPRKTASRTPQRFPARVLSTTLATPVHETHLDLPSPPSTPDELQVPFQLEKVFVPPGAELDGGGGGGPRVLKGSNIVLGPYAGADAQVSAAEFVKSSVRQEDCPADGLPEFALVGRSNVGKSSLATHSIQHQPLPPRLPQASAS